MHPLPRAIAIAALIATSWSNALAQPIPQADAIDKLVQDEMRARRIPGVAVAVVQEGRAPYVKGYGIANLETDTPVKGESVFEIASITKQFTAAAVLMLVEDGKIALDDRVSVHLEQTPDAWKDITIRHLLTHTSGLPVDAIVFSEGSALLNITTRAAFQFIARTPLLYAPGERSSYSDAGYFLLGMVIEKASGQSYATFLRRRIFEPLQMTQTGVLDRSRILKNHVSVYTIRQGEIVHWRRDWQYELPSFFGLYSTAGDLALWDAALRTEKLLKRATLDSMWTPARLKNSTDALVAGQLYGFGWELGNMRGRRTVGHSGASGTYILRFLDEPLSVIVLTNLDVASGPHAAMLARRLAELVRPELGAPRTATTATDPESAMTVRLRELLASMANEQESPLMTLTHAAFYRNLPAERRAQLARQMKAVTSLTFLGRDDMTKRWASADPTTHLLHYRAETGERPLFVSFEITASGKVATLRLAP